MHFFREISGKRAGNFSSTLSSLERDTTAYGSVIKQGVETVKARPGKTSEIESNMDKMANIEIGKMEKKTFGSKQYTDYEDRFQYFLGLALALLLAEALVGERKSRWWSNFKLFDKQ